MLGNPKWIVRRGVELMETDSTNAVDYRLIPFWNLHIFRGGAVLKLTGCKLDFGVWHNGGILQLLFIDLYRESSKLIIILLSQEVT